MMDAHPLIVDRNLRCRRQSALPAVNENAERLKHRDLGIPASATDDIDYQHARYYSQLLGRYLSPDPIRHANVTSLNSTNRTRLPARSPWEFK